MPIDGPWTPNALVPLPAALYSKASTAVHNCVASNVNYVATTYPGTSRITGFVYVGSGTDPGPGGALEQHIRLPAVIAFCLGSLIGSGAYDTSKTATAQSTALATTVRLVDSLAAAHVANGGNWGQNAPQGVPLNSTMATAWQCSLWAWFTGFAGWMVWGNLSTAQRTMVTAMVTAEADRFLAYPVPYWRNRSGTVLSRGDSKAEENPWHAAILFLAIALTPTHASAATWLAKALELSASANASPSDVTATRRLHGMELRTLIAGSNIELSGSLENHNLINPNYMAATVQNMLNGLTFANATRLVPAACLHNAERIYRAMSEVTYTSPPAASPGGTIYTPGGATVYYPGDPEGDPDKMASFIALDLVTHCAGADGSTVPAATWGDLHVQRQLDMQIAQSTARRSNWDFFNVLFGVLASRIVTVGAPLVSAAPASTFLAAAQQRAGSPILGG